MAARGAPPRLLVTSVTRADIPCPEDTFERRLLEGARDAPAEAAPRRPPIPETFAEGEERAPNDIPCWHCMASFETPPVFVPTSMKRAPDALYPGGRAVMAVLGNFCSFNCAAGHINRTYGESGGLAHKHETYHGLLTILYRMVTGRAVLFIEAAPHFTELQRFGGPVSDAAHSARMRELDLANRRCYRSGEVTVKSDRVSAWELAGAAGPAAGDDGDEPCPDGDGDEPCPDGDGLRPGGAGDEDELVPDGDEQLFPDDARSEGGLGDPDDFFDSDSDEPEPRAKKCGGGGGKEDDGSLDPDELFGPDGPEPRAKKCGGGGSKEDDGSLDPDDLFGSDDSLDGL